MKKSLIKLVTGMLFAVAFMAATATAYSPQISDETKNSRLRWRTGTITISLSASLTKPPLNIKLDSDVSGAVQRSLATWENAADIKFNEVPSDRLSVSPAGNSGDGISLVTMAPTAENLLLFAGNAAEIPAKTRVFYNRRGFITEADIVLNPYVQFSTDGTIGTYDLEATLAHEIGHLLGLEHSHMVGSTMQNFLGKNGIYNLPQTASRTLSLSDVTNIRALYGAKADDEDCCGSLKGRLSLSSNLSAQGFHLWLEDSVTGKIHGGTLTHSDGTFQLDGLNARRYRVYAQDAGERQKNRKQLYSAADLGEIAVEKGKIVNFEKQINVKDRTFSLKYVGFNGQISNIPVPVNRGKSFQIYIGGENLKPNEFTVSVNSPFIKVYPGSVSAPDYGEEITVLSFLISLADNTPFGEYTIKVQKNSGEVEYFVGGIVNDEIVNPWNGVSSADFE